MISLPLFCEGAQLADVNPGSWLITTKPTATNAAVVAMPIASLVLFIVPPIGYFHFFVLAKKQHPASLNN